MRIYQLIKNCHTCRLRNICSHIYSVVSSYVGIYVRKKQKNYSIDSKHSDIFYESRTSRKSIMIWWMYSIMATQLCSNDVHLSIKSPERVLYRFNNLIKFDTELANPFLLNLFFQLVLGTRFIQKLHTVMILVLLKNHGIRNQEILRLSAFYLISFNIMEGFKVKAKASAYLGWRCGRVFVGGVCEGVDIKICVYGWGGWGLSEGVNVFEGGGRRETTPLYDICYIKFMKKFYPINLIKMTKIENKNCKCSK